MAGNFIRLAVPSVLTNFFSFSVLAVNTVYAGQFEQDSASKLAAVGLGGMILGIVCRNIVFGINSAQETLVSQAYGQG